MHWCCHQYKNLMKTNVGWEIVALYIPSEETPICTHFSTNLFIGQATVMYYRPLISVSVLRTARVVQAHIETMILLVGAFMNLYKGNREQGVYESLEWAVRLHIVTVSLMT